MVKLRLLQEKDAPFMTEWMHDPEISQYFQKDMKHITLEDARRFCWEACRTGRAENGSSVHYAIVEDSADEYMGTISLKSIDLQNRSAEYAVSTRKCAHGKGIAAQATRLILREGFEKLNLHRIYLNVLSDNVRAVKFYEKAGFRFEGEFAESIMVRGEWKSLKWYAMLQNEFVTGQDTCAGLSQRK